jgi:hypothetical protein
MNKPTAASIPQRHRFSTDEYYRMADGNILSADTRVESINGEIYDLLPAGSVYIALVNRLSKLLIHAVGDRLSKKILLLLESTLARNPIFACSNLGMATISIPFQPPQIVCSLSRLPRVR